jgi:hypothetical protein
VTGASFGSRSVEIGAAIAICFVLTIAQLPTGVPSIQPESPGRAPGISETTTAILTIRDNRPVTVNGSIATSGATILSGTAIDTPEGVVAVVNLGSLSAVDIAPGTTLSLAFAQKDTLNVVLVKGCASLHVPKGIVGEIHTPQGAAEKIDSNAGGAVSLCVSQSANRGAVDKAESEGLFGLGKDAALAIIGGRIGETQGVALIGRGSNPGPSAP